MIQGTEYTEKADVYSYAVILWYEFQQEASEVGPLTSLCLPLLSMTYTIRELYHRAQPFESFSIGFSNILEDKIVHEGLRPDISSLCPEPYAFLIR